jgi:hypothetical protein
MTIIHPAFSTTTKKDETMKITIAIVAALIFAAFSVQAADQVKKSASPVQPRKQYCNAEAKRMGLKGDERKIFLNDCLGVSAQQKQPKKASSSKNRNKW